MYINKIQSNTSFQSAQLNILAMADNHGNFLSLNPIAKLVEDKKNYIFKNASDNSTMNVFAIAGDYFMNTTKRGFFTDPRLTNGDIQYNFLQNLIKNIKKHVGENNKFETLYTLGNHCFDGGDEWILKTIKKAPMTTILTNINPKKSPFANIMLKENKNVVTSKIISIPDNKSKLEHKVLFLGVTIPTLNYYAPGVVYHTQFYDNSAKNDAMLNKFDLEETIISIKEQIEKFKREHPNGAVVVLSHTGNRISKILSEEIINIDVMLNGHDHKDTNDTIGKTHIFSLGQNNNFVKSVNLSFDDNGKLADIKSNTYYTKPYIKAARNDVELNNFVVQNLKKDLVPLVNFNDKKLKKHKIVLDDTIRYSNNIIANYVSSGIKEAAKLKVPQLNAIGIPSTIFRNGLKSNEDRTTFNNIDLIKMFDGVSEHLSEVKVGNITGEELIALVLENTKNNLQDKTRNGIIQWSDIQINKKLLAEVLAGKNTKPKLASAIKIRNNKTGKFEAIRNQKNYCILMSNKYLVKDNENIRIPQRIRPKFYSIGETYDSLFRKYLEMVNYKIDFTNKTLEKRIIT